MMTLLCDTREQRPLEFKCLDRVNVKMASLCAGDYTATYVVGGHEVSSAWVVERKEIGDLFSSYTSGYERERAKFIRAKDSGLGFILAIEEDFSDVLKGYTYTKGGKTFTAKKDGISMIRQLMSCEQRYGIRTWFCRGRAEMAFRVQEWFLSEKRKIEKERNNDKKIIVDR